MPNNGESPSQRSHSKETFPEIFPEIKINEIRRTQIINIFEYLKKLDKRVTKLEKKKWWQWNRKKEENKDTSKPPSGLGKKKRSKRKYKKKKRKYKKRTKRKSYK